MNFVDGRLAGANGSVFFDEGSARLQLLPAYAAAVKDHIGKDVTLGIRPEALFTHPGKGFGAANSLSVRINVVEPLGADMDLYLATVATDRIVARIDAQRDLRPGQEIDMYVDMRKVHIFERDEDGRNLSLAALQD
jgi:multiple sugar transport system ATP-binding protein